MEILFRGVDTQYNIATGWMYNVWRTGSLIEYDSGQVAIVATADRYGHWIFSNEVIPETVGQYTGIDDRNGVKIFEGDICKMHYFFENYDGFGAFEDEAEITCRITITPFGLRFESEDMIGYLHEYVEEPVEELEVIGNIHDTPELMEVME